MVWAHALIFLSIEKNWQLCLINNYALMLLIKFCENIKYEYTTNCLKL